LRGATAARKVIVDRALEYIDKLVPEARGDPALQVELADAYERVADVQGNPGAANLGDLDAAAATYAKDLALREASLRADPDNTFLQPRASGTFWKLGMYLDEQRDFPGALAALRNAIALSERTMSVARDAGVIDRLGGDYWATANVLYDRGDIE